MREILFRGLLFHSKKWIDGNLLHSKDGQPYIIPSDAIEPDGHHLNIDSDDAFWVIHSTVGQFTGLLDKDGQRIFEGDSIEFDRKEWGGDDNIHTVEWDEKEGCWNWGGGGGSWDMEFRKVIGNIHEEVKP